MNENDQVEAPEDENMVDVHEASIADLDAVLESAKTQEAEAPTVEEGATTEEVSESPQPEAEVEQSTVAPKGANPAISAKTYTQEEVQRIVADNARLQEEGQQRELFVKRRSTELGALRAENARLIQERQQIRERLAQGLQDKLAEDPLAAIEDRDAIKELDKQIAEIQDKDKRAVNYVEAERDFLNNVNIDEVSLDDLAEVLRAEGVPESSLAQFRKSPFGFMPNEALIRLGKHAMDRKQLSVASSDRSLLAKEVLRLTEENKRLKAKPGQVIGNLQRNLNRAPPMTSATSTTARRPGNVDVTQMSTAELDSALANSLGR